MNELLTLAFGHSDLPARLQKMDAIELNTLEFRGGAAKPNTAISGNSATTTRA